MPSVLVVDDEAQILGALKRLLRRLGLEVHTARSGEEALSVLESVAPDLVLSDLRMPGMSGAELLAQVRVRLPGARRVLLSGHADPRSVASWLSGGEICRFVDKPWDDAALGPMLLGLLGERAAEPGGEGHSR